MCLYLFSWKKCFELVQFKTSKAFPMCEMYRPNHFLDDHRKSLSSRKGSFKRTVNVTVFESGTFELFNVIITVMCKQLHRAALNSFLNGTKNGNFDGTCKLTPRPLYACTNTVMNHLVVIYYSKVFTITEWPFDCTFMFLFSISLTLNSEMF